MYANDSTATTRVCRAEWFAANAHIFVCAYNATPPWTCIPLMIVRIISQLLWGAYVREYVCMRASVSNAFGCAGMRAYMHTYVLPSAPVLRVSPLYAKAIFSRTEHNTKLVNETGRVYLCSVRMPVYLYARTYVCMTPAGVLRPTHPPLERDSNLRIRIRMRRHYHRHTRASEILN